jgi:hypothetical protein
MDLSDYQNEVSIVINRSAECVYDLVSDVSMMGRWSLVCTGGVYDEDGEWFTGTNAVGDATWETRCRVVAAERSREFAFVNYGEDGQMPLMRWGFLLCPIHEGGTKVIESWQVLAGYVERPQVNHDEILRALEAMKSLALDGMPETLAALKRDAEAKA